MILRQTLAALLLSACPALAQSPTRLECTGPFAKAGDEAALVARFGRANVKTVDLDGPEGSTERGTAVFPDDPARRIEVFWHDVARRRRPASISVRRGSAWTFRAAGSDREIAASSTLADVEAANGRPFRLMGFGWDMGGYTAGWAGGKLDDTPGGCSLSVRFDPDPKARSAALAKVSGDRRLSSSDPAVAAVKPVVSQISLGWPE